MGIVYNPDGTVSTTGPGMTYIGSPGSGVNPAPAPSSSGDLGGILTSKFGSMGGTPAGTVTSMQTNTPGANTDYTALLQSLMQQGQQQYDSRMSAYKNLMASITGPKGLLSQLGKTGEQRIATNEQNMMGKTAQDLVSRGLDNTTIRPTLMRGVANDAENQRQSLAESVAGQKMNTQMQLFGMNPAPGMDTYLNMLTRLGAVSRPQGAGGQTILQMGGH